MEPHNEPKQAPQPPKAVRERRFRIVKLEERIAPGGTGPKFSHDFCPKTMRCCSKGLTGHG